MSISVFELFKVGIGPSSSHTVGPMVAAKRFVCALDENQQLASVASLNIVLFGSLGLTGKGHGSGKAIVLGLLGESPESVDIESIEERMAQLKGDKVLALLDKHKISFDLNKDLIYNRKESLPGHVNGMRFIAFDQYHKLLVQKDYYSVGGGFVLDEGNEPLPLETDTKGVNPSAPYPFKTGANLLALCEQHQKSIAEIVFANEKQFTQRSEIENKLDSLWQVMQSCVKRGCEQEGYLPGGLKVERRAKKLHEKLQQKVTQDPLDALDWVTLYALAVNEENASGGRIVTAPTNGAAGIIPAVLHYYVNFIEGANQTGIHDFLLTAAAVGFLFKENASISGAEVGCQGEVGSACSMAAAGLTAVLGGTPAQIENAAEIAMEHHLGLTCDPIGGLVQIPCIERNAVASVNAIHASRMALNNEGSHVVSLDKVIKTMRETGKDMLAKYKETSRGGLAVHVIEVPVNIVEC